MLFYFATILAVSDANALEYYPASNASDADTFDYHLLTVDGNEANIITRLLPHLGLSGADNLGYCFTLDVSDPNTSGHYPTSDVSDAIIFDYWPSLAVSDGDASAPTTILP